MSKLQYKISLITILFFGATLFAQKFDKKYTEEFNTTANVVIDVDTRHTDIQIETWSKNMVSIEAFIVIEGASKEKADEIIKNWKFRALGNKDQIEISSKTSSLFADRFIFNYGDALTIGESDFNFVVAPEVSVGNLGILDSFEIVMPDLEGFPEMLVIPDISSFNFEFDMPEFDYENYKNDKNYMKEWQEKMKKSLKKMRVELEMNTAKKTERTAKLKVELKARQAERKRMQKERVEVHKRQAEERKKGAKLRKEVLDKRKKELAKRRIEVRNILADRDKIKIKRVVKIRAPKDAKFNMNVKYGSLSFPN